jgi:hypothetical protein
MLLKVKTENYCNKELIKYQLKQLYKDELREDHEEMQKKLKDYEDY